MKCPRCQHENPATQKSCGECLGFLHRKRVTDFAARHVLPAVAGVRDFVDDGGLMSKAASALRLKTELFNVSSPEQFEGAFSQMARRQIEGLLVFPDPMFYGYRAEIVQRAEQNRFRGQGIFRSNNPRSWNWRSISRPPRRLG